MLALCVLEKYKRRGKGKLACYWYPLFSLRLRPRMMVDVSDVDLSTTILGEVIDVPICVAPTGQHRFAHSIGEVGTARG